MDKTSFSFKNVTIEQYFIFLFVFSLTLLAGYFVYSTVRSLLEKKVSQKYSKFAARILQYIVFGLGMYFGLYKVLKLDLTALAASMGIITVAIAFSSQQLVQNIIAGILISIKRPIWYEDWVEIGNSGVSKVKDIVLTQTILRSIDGRIIYLPNSMLLSSSIINYTKAGFVEVPVTIAILLNKQNKIEEIRNLIFEVLEGCPPILPNVSKEEMPFVQKVLQMPSIKNLFNNDAIKSTFTPKIYITDITLPKVTLSVRFWIREVHQKNQIVSDFLTALIKKLNDEGIEAL